MKLISTAGIIFALLTFLGVAARPALASPPSGYTLVWHDEFNAATDPNETVGSPPDPAYWSYDTGAGAVSTGDLFGVPGLYTTDTTINSYTTTNATIVTDALAPNGTALQIQASQSGGNFDSSRIKTSASSVIGTQPQYGYFESAIEPPAGAGLYSAWWILGVDEDQVGWPDCGEATLFEQIGTDPTMVHSYESDGGFYNQGQVTFTPGQYNTYGFLWTPTTQVNYYNGTAYNTFSNVGGAFLQPFYFLYNVAVTGNPDTTVFPANLNIGYLRVYQPTGSVQTVSNVVDATPPVVAGGTPPIPSGTYQITTSGSSPAMLNDLGSSTDNGGGADFAAPTGGAQESWAFTTGGVVPTGDYNISNGSYCLQAPGWSTVGNPTEAADLEVWQCNGNSLQSWNVAAVDNFYQIEPASSDNLCISWVYDGQEIGNGPFLAPCIAYPEPIYSQLEILPSAPGTPSLNTVGGVSEITLSWTASGGATSYNVYRGTTPGGEGGTPFARDIPVPIYEDTRVVAGTTYYYTVNASNASATSSNSNEASATLEAAVPAVPRALTATLAAGGLAPVNLVWTAGAGATSYTIWRGFAADGAESASIAAGVTTTAYTDTSVAPGGTYYYTVTGINASGTSPSSNEAVAALTLTAPTLTATPGISHVTLSWTADAGGPTYNLYRATVSGAEGDTPMLSGYRSTSEIDANIIDGTTYYYKVAAVDAGGVSALSNEVVATPESTTPPPVAINDSYGVLENQTLTIAAPGVLGNDTDTFGDAFTAVLVAAPSHGSLSLNQNGSFTYTPSAGFMGADMFTYQDQDSIHTGLLSNISTVTIQTFAFSSVYSFQGPSGDGIQPNAGLTLIPGGSFYGVDSAGGSDGDGTVFQVTPNGVESTLYSFTAGTDGKGPIRRLVLGGDSNLYASTPYWSGIPLPVPGYVGPPINGTIFSITPDGPLSTIDPNIVDVPDLIFGPDGNLYGTTLGGGANNAGSIFKFSLSGGGYTTLYSFTGSGPDGGAPLAGLVLANDGNLYGTTCGSAIGSGSGAPDGTVFQFNITTGQLNTLHDFNGTDGYFFEGALVQGSDGDLYGTSYDGGNAYQWSGGGVIFKITTGGAFTSLHAFSGSDGANPEAALLPASDGNLYGTTTSGGSGNGVLFLISPSGSFSNLYSFSGLGGADPHGSLTQGSDGSLWGTTFGGGTYNDGTIFRLVGLPLLSPPSAPTNLTASLSIGGHAPVGLSWTASAGTTIYNVYRGTTAGGENGTAIGSAAAGHYSDTSSLTAGLTYYYTVKAVNAGGTSGASNEASATLTPAAPTSLTATAAPVGLNPVTLAWTASTGATGYQVYRGTGQIGSTAIPGYIDSGAAPGVANSYTVVAVNAGGTSAHSTAVSVTLVPAPPATLTVTAGNSQITLNWDASNGVLAYRVYRSTAPGAELIIKSGIRALTYTDTGSLTSGITYYYKVTAVNAVGASAYSNEAHATFGLVAPASLTATAGLNLVTLNWSASTGALVYRVYRSTSSGLETILKGGISVTTFVDTAAVNGTEYFYKVTAANAVGVSAYSNEAHATPGPQGPLAPTGLSATASAGGVGPVTLNWTASAGATVYRVYRATISGGEGTVTLKGGITTPTYTDTSILIPGITYYYKVTAVNAFGASPLSNEAVVVLSPAAPASLTATAGVNSVTLNWSASTGALVYRVYRSTTSGGETILKGGIGVTTYVDTAAVNGIHYYYKVTAVNTAGASGLSNEASTTPESGAQTSISSSAMPFAGGVVQVAMRWTASAGGSRTLLRLLWPVKNSDATRIRSAAVVREAWRLPVPAVSVQ